MRIRFQTDGGVGYFPGLAAPVTVDTADLPPARAADLEGLVRTAGFFGRPEAVGTAAAGAADLRSHTITIEDDGRSHSIVVTEPIEDAALQALIESLSDEARAARER